MSELTIFDSSLDSLSIIKPTITTLILLCCDHLVMLEALPPGLITLRIRDCPLRKLPPLPSTLQELYIEDCPLVILPPLEHTSLQTLWCKHTLLTTIPPLPSTLEYLEVEEITMNSLLSMFDTINLH
jgi:Leucine-rich repeat (LRR) protein